MGGSNADTRDASRCHTTAVPQHDRLRCRIWFSDDDQGGIIEARAPVPFPSSWADGAEDRPPRVPQMSTARDRDGGQTQSGGVKRQNRNWGRIQSRIPDRLIPTTQTQTGTTFSAEGGGFFIFLIGIGASLTVQYLSVCKFPLYFSPTVRSQAHSPLFFGEKRE